jgi:organic radical activating enzyme
VKTRVAGPTAALAGIPAGLQAQGPWAGRRQLFIRFAGEAETATMYTADALANEIERATTRSRFHSVSIGGRDPLDNVEYLTTALGAKEVKLPVMLDCDGQRPEEIKGLGKVVQLVQVSMEGSLLNSDGPVGCTIDTMREAARLGAQHAIVVVADERTSDSVVLRVVEQAHAASEKTMIVVHPSTGTPVDRDRRWTMLLERAMALHGDVQLMLRLPPPTGTR